MAEFLPAYLKSLKNEGGDYSWSNRAEDPGKETVMGISRVHWPEWPGWPMVDEAKKSPQFPGNLKSYVGLPQMVRAFYKTNFWDRISLDSFGNQAVAEKLFDTAINVNVPVAIKFLQRSLNSANRKGKLWPNLTIDSVFGPGTLEAFQECERLGRTKGVLLGLKILQGAHYFVLMEKNEALEEFYMGWLERAMS